MPISIVKLGSPRKAGEGLRLGTVRRPPRGIPKAQWAKLNFYDLWFPLLSPSQALVAFALQAEDDSTWRDVRTQIYGRDEQAGSVQGS